MKASSSTPSPVVTNHVTQRMQDELTRRGFGVPLAGWLAHSIESHGLKWTMETLALTLYDVHQTAKVEEHNHTVMLQVWDTIGSKSKPSGRLSPPTG